MNAGEHVGRSFSPFRRFSRKALVPGGDTCDLVHKFIKLSDNPLVKYHIFLLAYVEKKSYRSSFLVGDAMFICDKSSLIQHTCTPLPRHAWSHVSSSCRCRQGRKTLFFRLGRKTWYRTAHNGLTRHEVRCPVVFLLVLVQLLL